MRPASEVVAEIRSSVFQALWLVDKNRGLLTADPTDDTEVTEERVTVKEGIRVHMVQAFMRTIVFAEVANLASTRAAVERLYDEAEKTLDEFAFDDCNEPYMVWGARLENYLDALLLALDEPGSEPITRELISILKEAQYSITQTKYFGSAPTSEADVHNRIEAILRCLFKDLMHKPKVATFLKNFEPDTGLPSVKTLIEYKIVKSEADARQKVDELFADVVGYSSPDWKTLICVIYETTRIFSEAEWNVQFQKQPVFQDSEVAKNIRFVVLSGESRPSKSPPRP